MLINVIVKDTAPPARLVVALPDVKVAAWTVAGALFYVIV